MSASPPIRNATNNVPTTLGVGPGTIARRKLHVVSLGPPPEPSVVVAPEPSVVAPPESSTVAPEVSPSVTPEPSTAWREPSSRQPAAHTDLDEEVPEVPMSLAPRYIALALFGLSVALCAAIALELASRSPSSAPSTPQRPTLPAPTAPNAQPALPRPVPTGQTPVVTPVSGAPLTREVAARRGAVRETRSARRTPVARSLTAAPSPGAPPPRSTPLSRCLAR
jgi:hypothetical protein